MADAPTKTGMLTTRTLPNRRDAGNDALERPGTGRSLGMGEKSARRAKIIETIKTLLWVVPLTILIWVYAERTQIRPGEVARVPIKVVSTASDRIVTLVNPEEDGRVSLELEGPQGGLQNVREALSDPKAELIIAVPEDLPVSYTGDIPIAERIGQNDLFAREAVTVVRTRPATITIRSERKVTAVAKVQMNPKDRLKITGTVRFSPETVELEVPESMVGPTTRPDDLIVYADMGKVSDLPAGEHVVSVPVFFPDRKDLTIRTKHVEAIVDIKPSKPLELKSIRVDLQIPAGVLAKDEYHFTTDPMTVPNVSVTGPANAIDELERLILRDKTFIPKVVIEISPEELTRLTASESRLPPKRLGPENYVMPKHLAKDLTVTSSTSEITVTVTRKN